MWDTQSKLRYSLLALACFIPAFFLFTVFIKKAEGRRRCLSIPFWLITISLLISIMDLVYVVVFPDGMTPDVGILEPAFPNLLTLLLQLDSIIDWKSVMGRRRNVPRYAYVISWALQIAFETLNILYCVHRFRSKTLNMAGHLIAPISRCCLIFALFAWLVWPDTGGGIRLPEGSDDDEGPEPESTVQGEIRNAGGILPWVKSSCKILKDFIIPKNMGWMWLNVLGGFLCKLAVTILTIYLPDISGYWIDSVVRAFPAQNPELATIPLVTLSIAQSLTSPSGLSTLQDFIWGYPSLHREKQGIGSLFRHVLNSDASFFSQVKSSDIKTAIDIGIQVCEVLDFLILEVTSQTIVLIWTIFKIITLYGQNTMLVLCFLAAVNIFLIFRANQSLIPIFDRCNTIKKAVERFAQEKINAWSTIFTSNETNREIGVHDEGLESKKKIDLKLQRSLSILKMTSIWSMEVGKLITIELVLRHAVYNGGKPGSVLVFGLYWSNMTTTLNFFAGIQTRLTQGLTAARQLRKILEIKSTIIYGSHELHLDNGKIQMENVSFHHHKEENGDKRHVLKNFSVEFAAGTTTAIIGPSGSGKTTIVGAIAKVFQPQEGSITFDDQDTNTLKRGEVSKHIAYLEQKTAIFDATFAENIAYGYPGASLDDIQAAAKKARIHDSIMERSGGYSAKVGENGSNLSGGENQRLGVARLFMTNKPIIIIDEATSAQDAVTQSQINESLEEHCRNKTVIKIAHRLSTIKGADKIIRLEKDEDGCARIAEQGTHDELMEQGGGYSKLWNMEIGADGKVSERPIEELLAKQAGSTDMPNQSHGLCSV